jgi:hypothetical protein
MYPAIDPFGAYLDIMSQQNARDLADVLIEYAKNSFVITWNGMNFDFPLLAAVCAEPYSTEIKRVALKRHIDIGYCMVTDIGFMIGLDKAAKSLGIQGKTEGMHGYLAPLLWHPERPLTEEELVEIKPFGVIPGSDQAKELCLKYVGQDSKVSVDVYEALVIQKSLSWLTRTGKVVRTPWIPSFTEGRLMTVYEASMIEPVRTPWWPENPFNKDRIISWTNL